MAPGCRRHADQPDRPDGLFPAPAPKGQPPTNDLPATRGVAHHALTEARILRLQRTIGNAAVERLIAPRQPITVQRLNGAVPTMVRNGGAEAYQDGAHVGMKVAIEIVSSTGAPDDLADVMTTEVVSWSHDHTGIFVGLASFEATERQRRKTPGNRTKGDVHYVDYANVDFARCFKNAGDGAQGTYKVSQLDIYTAATGEDVAIPASGYVIKRTFTVHHVDGAIILELEQTKKPKRVTVNGFTSGAGPSAALRIELKSIKTGWDEPRPPVTSEGFLEAFGI